jgi:hypothetical protein
MTSPGRRYVSVPQLFEVLESLGFSGTVNVTRDGQPATMAVQELKSLCYEAIENGQLEGGPLVVEIPGRTQKLVGDPEGEFWIE